MRIALLFIFAALSVSAQTNLAAPANQSPAISNSPAVEQRFEKVRMKCIENRRIICGKILKVLPDGLVVDSGYTNLMRAPLNRSWLIPGDVVAVRATNLVEASQPDAVCIGLVFVTDLPKARGAKPKLYDYVNLEGFPVGLYTYTSVGTLQRTVREFSHKLDKAAQWNFDQSEGQSAPKQ
jgi:hypothetical protein